MEQMERTMIDMDDVIVSGGFLYLINLYLGTHYVEDDFTDYFMQDVIPDKKDFFKFFLSKNMYDYCEIKEHAIEVIRLLNAVQRIYIGTSYVFPEIVRESGIILMQKYVFLMDNFPYLNPHNFVFLTDKSVLNCENKVDDRIVNLSGARRKLLFSAYHNKRISDAELSSQGVERAKDWLDVKRLLLTK